MRRLVCEARVDLSQARVVSQPVRYRRQFAKNLMANATRCVQLTSPSNSTPHGRPPATMR